VGAYGANPNGKSHAGKSYVIFGKTDIDAIDLSKLGDESKYTIDYLGDKNANTLTGTTCQTQHTIYLLVIYRLDRPDKHPQLDHLIHHH
jgi:hypothetical protein